MTALVESVEQALHDNGRVTSKTIHVTGDDHTIVLHGVVDSLDEYGIAEEVAEAVPGVDKVENHLHIDGVVNTGPCCPQM